MRLRFSKLYSLRPRRRQQGYTLPVALGFVAAAALAALALVWMQPDPEINPTSNPSDPTGASAQRDRVTDAKADRDSRSEIASALSRAVEQERRDRARTSADEKDDSATSPSARDTLPTAARTGGETGPRIGDGLSDSRPVSREDRTSPGGAGGFGLDNAGHETAGGDGSSSAPPRFGYDIFERIESIDGAAIESGWDVLSSYEGKQIGDTVEIEYRDANGSLVQETVTLPFCCNDGETR